MPRRSAFALLLALAAIAAAQVHDKRVVAYYTSWSVYGRDYHVPEIPAGRITHINYAFANIDGDAGGIMLGDPYADIDRWYPGDSWEPGSLRGSFHQLQLLKAAHPHLKTLISVGGWTWSTHFSDVALTAESRGQFASSCVDFIGQYGFDGVDLDWEYPVGGGLPSNTTRPEDRGNYTLLLAELRAQLDAAGDYLLTIAAPASPAIMEHYELELIHPLLDWINVMSYDLHGPWGDPDADPVTHFNAALHADPDDPLAEPFRSRFNLAATLEAYLDAGVPPEKLHAGLAFYGRGYGGVPSQNDGLYAPYTGPAGAGTWEGGVFDYWDLAANYVGLGGYERHWQDMALVPWLYNPVTQIMISYDDSLSIGEKGAWIREAGLGGAMAWELSGDRNEVLLQALQAALADSGAGIELRIDLAGTDIVLSWSDSTSTRWSVYRLSSPYNSPEPEQRIALTDVPVFIDAGALGMPAAFYRVTGERD
jgi:chitinase